jgi:hypothetical protein
VGGMEKKGMEMTVEEDLDKTLHSIMGQCGQRRMMLRIKEWRRGITMSPKFVRVKVRVRRRSDIVLIWTSGICPVGDGQEMHGGRAPKETALQITIGVGKVKMKSTAMREMEPEREGSLGRRGMLVLVVRMLVQQKTQDQVHKGGRKIRNVYTYGFYENLDI